MRIINCPHCHTRVAPQHDGTCPSCRGTVDETVDRISVPDLVSEPLLEQRRVATHFHLTPKMYFALSLAAIFACHFGLTYLCWKESFYGWHDGGQGPDPWNGFSFFAGFLTMYLSCPFASPLLCIATASHAIFLWACAVNSLAWSAILFKIGNVFWGRDMIDYANSPTSTNRC